MKVYTRILAAIAAVCLTWIGVVTLASPAQADPPLTNCMPQLTTCGYPTFETTGVNPLTTLTSYNGVLSTSSNNQVIENLYITGCIVVQNTGVVIRNVKIETSCFNGIALDWGAAHQYTMTDSTVSCVDTSATGIVADSTEVSRTTISRVYVERCENAVSVTSKVTVEDSLLQAFESQPGISHGDIVQVFAGNNVTLSHNVMSAYNPMTSSVIADIFGVDNWVISNNFMMGGAFTLYCPHATNGFAVTGNRFYRVAQSPGADRRSPAFGTSAYCAGGDPDISWSGNYSDFDASAVAAA